MKKNAEEISLKYRQLFEKETGVKSLGWGSDWSQKIRFLVLLEIKEFAPNDSVLDVGCGFGDLSIFCENYLGIDCRQIAIDEACSKFPNRKFLCGTIDDVNERFDWVFASGLFCLRKNWKENTERNLSKMFNASRKGVACNFLSDLSEGKRNPEMKYATISEISEIASKISKKFSIRHDYLGNDCTLYIYRVNS